MTPRSFWHSRCTSVETNDVYEMFMTNAVPVVGLCNAGRAYLESLLSRAVDKESTTSFDRRTRRKPAENPLLKGLVGRG